MNTFNSYDLENCDACGVSDESCDFHTGQLHGELITAAAVRAVIDDPELANLVLLTVAERDGAIGKAGVQR